jgi:hypothetical protein
MDNKIPQLYKMPQELDKSQEQEVVVEKKEAKVLDSLNQQMVEAQRLQIILMTTMEEV